MISQKLNALNKAIDSLEAQKMQTNIQLDTVALISENTARPKTKATTMRKYPKKTTHPVIVTQLPKMPKQTIALIRQFYDSRCIDLKLQYNESSWQAFVQSYTRKNSNKQKLDLSNLNLGKNADRLINSIILPCSEIDLSRNHINCLKLPKLKQCSHLLTLTLENCNLKNDNIEYLFKILVRTPIKNLILSSPDMKDRNQLTRYEELYTFIKQSKTLVFLGLSNIQISPDNHIFQCCKESHLSAIDLSKNTYVSGMNKVISEVNLSYNSISDPELLRCPNTELKKLNITGNPIPYYLFEDFLTVDHYRNLTHLVLNDIPFIGEAQFIQTFIQRSIYLQNLQMINCQISRNSFLNIAYGLELNHTLKVLNLSKNKFPIKGVDEMLAHAFSKSKLRQLIMVECDIKDECGEVLFPKLCNQRCIEKINISKNGLATKTSTALCQCLKKKCYSLMVLDISQNFIKYDHVKEIEEYIKRNAFMDKSTVRDEFKTIKFTVIPNVQEINKQITNTTEIKKQIEKENKTLKLTLLEQKKALNQLKKKQLQEELKLIKEQENILYTKIQKLTEEIEQIQVSSNEINIKNDDQ